MNQQQLIDHLLKLNPMLTEAGAISIINTVNKKLCYHTNTDLTATI